MSSSNLTEQITETIAVYCGASIFAARDAAEEIVTILEPRSVATKCKETGATWHLAAYLYEKMEELDPALNEPKWGELSDRQKEFYCLLIRALLSRQELIAEAIAEQLCDIIT